MKQTIIILFYLLLAVLMSGCASDETSSKPRLAIGQDGRVVCGPNICVVASTTEGWREHRKALRANDTHGGGELLMTGKIFIVKQGTRVRVIDYDSSTYLMRIRIIEGKGTGLSGWLPFEHIVQ